MEGTNTLSAWIKTQDRGQLIRIGFRVIFFLLAWFYLGVIKGDLLYKLGESDYFLYDSFFVKDILSGKSGVLVYISRFILQFCCYPLLGAAIITALLSGLELLISKIFSIRKEWFIIGFIPSFAMVIMISSITYEIYDTFEISYATSNIIGFYIAILFFSLFKKCDKHIAVAPLSAIIIAISSIWIGPSAMVAIALIGTHELFSKKFIRGAIILILGGVFYYLTSIYSSYNVTPAFIGYSVMHPWPIAYYLKLFVITIVAHVVSVLALTSYQIYQMKESRQKSLWINPTIGILIFVGTVFGCAYPFALKEELRLEHLSHEMQWEKMVDEMEDMDISSRLLSAYRVIGLIGTKQLFEKIFNYNYDYCRPGFYKYSEEMGFYPELLLAAGFPQISYRWCMEFNTDTSKKPYLFQIMALCSFVNEEYELAQRYCNLLKETFYYDDWAQEMLDHLGEPDEYIKKYPILANIKAARPLTEMTGALEGVSGVYDPYMSLPRISAERRILTKLYRRKLDEVEREVRLSRFMKIGIPRCIQEGLVMKAILTNNPKMLQGYPIDQKVFDYVYEFVQYYKLHYNEEKLALKMRDKFGYSYCHYFSFGVGSALPPKDKK